MLLPVRYCCKGCLWYVQNPFILNLTSECDLQPLLCQKRETGFNLSWRHFSQFTVTLAALLSFLPKFIKLKLSLLAFEKFTDTFKFEKLKSELQGKDFYTTETFRRDFASGMYKEFFQVGVKYISFLYPNAIATHISSYHRIVLLLHSKSSFWVKKNTQWICREENVFQLISDLMEDNSLGHQWLQRNLINLAATVTFLLPQEMETPGWWWLEACDFQHEEENSWFSCSSTATE